MTVKRVAAWAFLALCALQVLLAGVWSVANSAKVPHYGDTWEMLETARTGVYVEGRMVAYPLFLRAVHDAVASDAPFGEEVRWEVEEPSEPVDCASPAWSGVVQWLQLVVVLASLAVAARALAGLSTRLALLLACLVATDPWVLHHAFALMTDALCLAALALFAAAAKGWLARGSLAALAGVFAAQVAAATLRWEKNLVLVCVGLGVVAGALVLSRGAFRRRALGLLAATALALPAANALNALPETRPLLFSPLQYWLHQRVIAGHLSEVWDDLSDETKAVVPREAAERYDLGVPVQRNLLPRLTGDDPAVLDRITPDMARAVWRAKSSAIVADAVLDVGRFLLTTPVFYWRVHLWKETFPEPFQATLVVSPFEAAGAYWIFFAHEPHWARRLDLAARALTAVGAAGGLVLLVRRLRRRELLPRDEAGLASWLPIAALLVANSCAFALSSDLFEMRYGLPSHVVLLALCYGALLRASLAALRPART